VRSSVSRLCPGEIVVGARGGHGLEPHPDAYELAYEIGCSPEHVWLRVASGPAPPTPAAAGLLDVRAVAAAFGVSSKTVYRAIGRGELRAARFGTTYRVAPQDAEQWRQANTVEVRQVEAHDAAADRRAGVRGSLARLRAIEDRAL
jgi:excisionase family DNA binding protein